MSRFDQANNEAPEEKYDQSIAMVYSPELSRPIPLCPWIAKKILANPEGWMDGEIAWTLKAAELDR